MKPPRISGSSPGPAFFFGDLWGVYTVIESGLLISQLNPKDLIGLS